MAHGSAFYVQSQQRSQPCWNRVRGGGDEGVDSEGSDGGSGDDDSGGVVGGGVVGDDIVVGVDAGDGDQRGGSGDDGSDC